MNLSVLQIGGAVFLSLFGGATLGQFPAKRRSLSGVAFGQWRERRMYLIIALGVLICFLPELLQEGRSLLTGIFQ